MKAMILAAGEGARLRPMTLDRPKPMLPLSGRPVLEHTLAWLRHHGVRQVAINVHYQPDKIMDHFKDGIRFGVELTYSVETRLLGTAGAVKRLADYFSDGPFVVIYGDVITDLELSHLLAFHTEQPLHPAITLSLYRVANPTECGIADLDEEGRLRRFVEKPRPGEIFSDLASAGVLVVDPPIVTAIPDGVVDFGRDVFPALLASGCPLYGWPIPSGTYLADMGTPEAYARVQRDWPTEKAWAFEASEP